MKKNIIFRLIMITVFICFDLFTKYITTDIDKPIINNLLSFYYTTNEGAAWSIMEGQILFFIIVGVIFIMGLSIFEFFEKDYSIINFIGFSLIIAGAIGNLIDRIIYGYVRDFIKLDFIDYPIFNFADLFLVTGVILFSINVIFLKKSNEGILGDKKN